MLTVLASHLLQGLRLCGGCWRAVSSLSDVGVPAKDNSRGIFSRSVHVWSTGTFRWIARVELQPGSMTQHMRHYRMIEPSFDWKSLLSLQWRSVGLAQTLNLNVNGQVHERSQASSRTCLARILLELLQSGRRRAIFLRNPT